MKTPDHQVIFAISIAVIVSYGYFLCIEWINAVKTARSTNVTVTRYLARKLSGVILLGLIPGVLSWIYFKSAFLNLTILSTRSPNLWVLMIAVSVLLILLNLVNSRSTDLQKVYPEMRLQEWDLKSIFIASGGWIIYLTAYEYLFRGILLFACLNAFSMWPAIAINIALYSSLHLYKGLKEALAAIPFGLFICYITIESSSILPAVIIHSLQAITAEISCIFRNPEMSFSFYKTKQP
ncbi:MAG: CPBP family intramembrane glutamic endopeptidase [Lentimicrobium sp.]